MKMKINLEMIVCLVLAAGAGSADAQTAPRLSLTMPIPGLAQISWSNNLAGWQLMSCTNPGASASWQLVPDTPLPLGDSLVVFLSPTNNSRFFRLQQGGGGGGGGGCVFHATPDTIATGESSTLSWCVDPETTYQILPTPGPVTGSNYVVSPTVTTVYTLIASNLAGLSSSYATVTVASASCAFAAATGYDCSLFFTYTAQPSSASLQFGIIEDATLTFHFTRVALNGSSAVYTATLGGTASVNDSETIVGSPPPITIVGSGTPLAGQPANLTIDCGSGTYTFDVQPVVDATWSGSYDQPARVGSIYINNRALPVSFGTISALESLPARGPFWSGGGDWYSPGDIGLQMFITGLVSDTTAGVATVGWTFTPTP